MLSKETFVAGITLLKKAFLGWKFDLNDNEQIGVWYMCFRKLSDKAFDAVITEYLSHNVNPPQSPRELTAVLVDKLVDKAKIKPEKALDYAREVISNCGGWAYEGRAEIYEALKKHPALYETVHEFEGELRNMSVDDTYTADRFRRAYEIKLRAGAIRQVDKVLGLNMPDEKKLLPGFLDYEQ